MKRINAVVVIRHLPGHLPTVSAVIRAEDWAQSDELDSATLAHLESLANNHIASFKTQFPEFNSALFITSSQQI